MLPTIKKYLFFRFKQIFRVLKEVGIGHLIALSPILIVVVLGMLHGIMTSHGASIAILMLFSIGGLHWSRKDRFYLQQLDAPRYILFLIDYILLFFPFLVCFIWWSKWVNLFTCLGGIFLLAVVPTRYLSSTNSRFFFISELKWIPVELFEWRTALRKNLLWIIPLYITSLVFSYFPVTALIVLALTALGICNFFQFFESRDVFLSVNRKQQLLKIKVFGSLKVFNLIMLPHYILFLYFHQSYQYIGALIIISVISQLIIAFAICMKYKNYRYEHRKVYNNMPLAIFVACWFYPFFWPIPIIMLIKFWRDAQDNLIRHYA